MPEEIHPKLQRLRNELDQTAKWIVGLLQSIEFPSKQLVISGLQGLSKLPSEQVMPTLKRISNLIYQGKQTASKGVRKDTGPYAARMKVTKSPFDDALAALQTTMKSAANISGSTRSDAGLYQRKVRGYTDADGNFHLLGADVVDQEGVEIPRMTEVFNVSNAQIKPKSGAKCSCGAPATYHGPDPYDAELHGDHEDVDLCDNCYERSIAEI